MFARYRNERLGYTSAKQRKEKPREFSAHDTERDFPDERAGKRPRYVWVLMSVKLRLFIVFSCAAAFCLLGRSLYLKRTSQLQYNDGGETTGKENTSMPVDATFSGSQSAKQGRKKGMKEASIDWIPIQKKKQETVPYCSQTSQENRAIFLDLSAGYGSTLRFWQDTSLFGAPKPPCSTKWEVFAFEGNRLVAPRTSKFVKYLNGAGSQPKFLCFPTSRDEGHVRAFEKALSCTQEGNSRSEEGDDDSDSSTESQQTSCLAANVAPYVLASARRNRLMANTLDHKWEETLQKEGNWSTASRHDEAFYHFIPAVPTVPENANVSKTHSTNIWDAITWSHQGYGDSNTPQNSFSTKLDTVDVGGWMSAMFSINDYVLVHLALDLEDGTEGEGLLDHYTSSKGIAERIDFMIFDCASSDPERCDKAHLMLNRAGIRTASGATDSLFATKNKRKVKVSIDSASDLDPSAIAAHLALECGVDVRVPCVPPPPGYEVQNPLSCGEAVSRPQQPEAEKVKRNRQRIYKFEKAPLYAWPFVVTKSSNQNSLGQFVAGALNATDLQQYETGQKAFIERYWNETNRPKSVLDVGCGAGQLQETVKEMSGWSLTCLEDKALRGKQSLADSAPPLNGRKVAILEDLPGLNEIHDGVPVRPMYDLVLSLNLLQHLGCTLIHVLAKYVKLDGHIFLEVPNSPEESISVENTTDLQATYWTKDSLAVVLQQAKLNSISMEVAETGEGREVIRSIAQRVA